MRATKEMGVEEIERYAKPEARETAAFDPRELQGLVDRMNEDVVRGDDDLAVPVERAHTREAMVALPRASASRLPRGSQGTPALPRSRSLAPWLVFLVAVGAALAVALVYR